MVLIFLSTLPVAACWEAPEPFEIESEDGNRVFVFNPAEDGMANAYAAVYEIINNERHLVYMVEGLSSFAYKGNFHFSEDMMHFARTFPQFGMSTFEVFSNGVRTRVVMRNDFIENYASIESETSIGPFYTVTWRIEEYPSENTIIKISTDEDNVLLFDLANAKFAFEDVLPANYTAPIDVTTVPYPRVQPSSNVIFVIAGSAVAFIGVCAFLLAKYKKEQ